MPYTEDVVVKASQLQEGDVILGVLVEEEPQPVVTKAAKMVRHRLMVGLNNTSVRFYKPETQVVVVRTVEEGEAELPAKECSCLVEVNAQREGRRILPLGGCAVHSA